MASWSKGVMGRKPTLQHSDNSNTPLPGFAAARVRPRRRRWPWPRCTELFFSRGLDLGFLSSRQPIAESELLTGLLEPTNEAYAIAKIAGIKLCQAYAREFGKKFICAMPTNLYGPGDNFDLNNSHVLPALLRKVHEAKVAGASEVV